MTPKELLDAGQLAAAIECLNEEVRSRPTDAQRRTFLFELLCFAGDYPRAERQLDVLARQGASAEAGVQVYRNVLAAEQARRRLFSEGLMPDFVFDPPPYLYWHLDAVNRLREESPVEALALLERSEQARPRLQGRLEGQSFQDWRDGDDLLAPVLEVIMQRHYVWLPFEQMSRLSIAAPRRLRDLLWIPAQIESPHGPVGEVFVPVLYPGTAEHRDDEVRLGRRTEWKTVADGPILGLGQRVFFFDGQDRGVLEVRDIEFDAPVSPEPTP
jgi:type VI secretion system protein ImpE